MIHSLTSDLPSFKELTFRSGLNILLADKSEGATDRQSRNGAGKTSFVELIHFLFGGKAEPDNIFRSETLENYTFKMRADIGSNVIDAARSGSKHSRVIIDGSTSEWHIRPTLDSKTGIETVSNLQWRELMGVLLFGLNASDGDDEAGKYQPSFRSLFSYFARRENSGGFSSPTQHSKMQQPWDQQVSMSFLLGLDAAIPREFQDVKIQENAMSALRKAAKDGGLGRYFGTAADLRTKLAIADARAKRLGDQVTSFNVVPEYSEQEKEASVITRDISILNDENTLDRELLLQLENSLATELAPVKENLDRLYGEAGIVLPGTVRERFEDVAQFHNAVIQNRRAHLSAEVESAKLRIGQRDRNRDRLDARRRQLMGILKSGGALEHYSRLQDEAGRAEAEAEGLRQRLITAERIESTKAELDIDRARLFKALQDDLHERKDIVSEAVLAFEELSNALYEKAGSLTISPTPNGPSIEVRIDAQKSKGITNMQIFCFDLMLVDLATRRGIGPGFLIHDSHLFDGVDERQVAKALQLGADHAEAVGYQYIVTMNSDALPRDGFREGFVVNDFVCETKLTDATETGGLFGIRFS